MEAKKSLGQHFLCDSGVLNRIKKEAKGACRIVEIGGGRGALTEKLLELNAPLTVVELDRELFFYLKDKFGDNSSFSIVNEDASVFKLDKKSTVLGNLPYNVSKRIIKNMVFQKHNIEKMVFMVQKEVADTIVAPTNCKDYTKFSVLVQLFFKVRRLFNVAKTAFRPQPKVESSVVNFIPYQKSLLGSEVEGGFFEFLNVLFQFPRKTIRNNIKSLLKEHKIKNMEHFLQRRPRELSIEEMYQLYREVYYE
jgi:16S rRNA (adenine1518-N6/adenine1519-N6)-dimethyltransferase